jgi:N-methylhydantoinase A
MMRAVKTVTTYRGRDPREFTMVAFGGNGGIHSVQIARALGIPRVMVPRGAGVFSAVGLLEAELSAEASAALRGNLRSLPAEQVAQLCETLAARVRGELPAGTLRFEHVVDLRYAGQAFELPTPMDGGPVTAATLAGAAARFEDLHQRIYGHRLDGAVIELVTVRVIGRVAGERRPASPPVVARPQTANLRSAYFGPDWGSLDTPVITRDQLGPDLRRGPFIVEEYEGTTVVPPDCSAALDADGNILIHVGLAAAPAATEHTDTRATTAILGATA